MSTTSKHDSLHSKLDDLDSRSSQITAQLNDPTIASDHVKATALAREQSQLARIVTPYRRYKKLLADHAQAVSLADDSTVDQEMREMAAAEMNDLAAQAEAALEEIKGLLVMSDESKIGSVMLEIRAGTGGDEAALFADDLLNMYRRYAESRGWAFEVMSASTTELGGLREAIINVRGQDVWARLGYEGGGHRVQRVPQTEAQGRIHTSAATVAVLPEPEEVDADIDWNKDVIEHTMRASGPGGQNVNKVESAIKLEHIPTGLTVSMRDEKSQHKNRAKARRVLAARVYEHHRSQQLAVEAAARKEMIGSGDRSQRVRTYNFPQNRCTDHRLKGDGAEAANYNLERVISGDLDELIDSLITHDKTQRLANL